MYEQHARHPQRRPVLRAGAGVPGPAASRPHPTPTQAKDLDFLLNVGHLFSLIVYGQLILEQAALTGLDDDIVDQIFDFQVDDFNTYAVALHGKPTSTQAQQDWALGAIRKPVPDAERFDRVWERVRPTTAPTR